MHALTHTYPSFFGGPDRSVEDFGAMYDQTRVPATRELAGTSSPSDVTSWIQASPPHSPTTSELPFEDILDDPDYDQISDRADVEEGEACWRGDPVAIRRRAIMAEDFSEGKLETVVDSPQKENAGTQTQYVSYQITTKVGAL
jgi:sorting nexin-4